VKTFFAFILCVTIFVTGCNFTNTEHYRVTNVAVGSHSADRIKSIVRMAARKTGMTNEISTSIVANTLVSFGGGGKYPIVLGAHFCNGDVLIDIQALHGHHISAFESAKHHLIPALTKEFGSSFQTLDRPPANDCGPGFSVDLLVKP